MEFDLSLLLMFVGFCGLLSDSRIRWRKVGNVKSWEYMVERMLARALLIETMFRLLADPLS